MKKIVAGFLIAAFLILPSGCSGNRPASTVMETSAIASDSTLTPASESSTPLSSEDTSPSSVTETVPKDRPDDFVIYFAFGINPEQLNILNTYDQIITKDLVMKGTASADFIIPEEDLDRIYSELYELQIYMLPEKIVSSSVGVTPNTEFTVRFIIDRVEYSISGDATTEFADTTAADRLVAFRDFLMEYMYSTAEYKSLPEAEGGYD